MLPRDSFCNILVKKVASFCPCPQSLPEPELKRFGLIPLGEEMSKQPSIDSAVWFLVFMLMKIYNEEKAEFGKLQNINFELKKSTRKWTGAMSHVQGAKWIEKWNKGSGDLRARSHLTKFPTCGGKNLKKCLELGTYL